MRRLVYALAPLLVLIAACERTPKDVEKWRNAKKGMEKMQTWAASPKEPMDVRVRAVRIMIEEGRTPLLVSTFDDIESKSEREKLAAEVAPVIEEMWEKKDFPTLDSGDSAAGGKKVKVGDSMSVKAKDAAYYVEPHASGDAHSRFQSILAQWLSKDWKLRNQLGNVTLGQILPRAGEAGVENALTWLEETDRPGEVAATLRKHADEKVKTQIAKVIAKRAEKAHPKLSGSLKRAVVETRQEPITDYLETAIRSPKSSPKFVDAAMEALKTIQGKRATGFFAELIEKKSGALRWAAINDLIQIRGKGGVLSAAIALPLDREAYTSDEEGQFKKDANWFGSFTVTEMQDEGVSSISDTVLRMIDSGRWPARAMALAIIQQAYQNDASDLLKNDHGKLVSTVEELTSNGERLPNWGEPQTLGGLARETLELLES
ncbi:MAG: hypothetical protein ABEL76_17305 [Bradymonadaceae bacterium]